MIGRKYDGEKPKMHLLPPKAIEEVSKVLTFGAEKYGEYNWKQLEDLQNRYTSAALRHIFEHMKEERNDKESGLNHLAHAICCLLFKLEIALGEEIGEEICKTERPREPLRFEPSESTWSSELHRKHDN